MKRYAISQTSKGRADYYRELMNRPNRMIGKKLGKRGRVWASGSRLEDKSVRRVVVLLACALGIPRAKVLRVATYQYGCNVIIQRACIALGG